MMWTQLVRNLEPGFYWCRPPVDERRVKGEVVTIYGDPYVRYVDQTRANYDMVWPEKLSPPTSLEVLWGDKMRIRK